MNRAMLLPLALATACGASAPSMPASTNEDGDVERAVDAELTTLLATPGVRSARIVVLDPRDGRIVAMDARDASGTHDPLLPATEVRSHGSTAKALTAAAALTHRSMTLTETVEGGSLELEGETIEDATVHGPMTLSDAMAFSSNVGFARIYQRVGRDALFETFTAFGLGRRIPDAARTSELAAAQLAYGGTVESTLELATAYAAIANGGELHAPWSTGETPTAAMRVLDADVAATVMQLLEDSVTREDATGNTARIEGVRVGGKTGTVRGDDDTTYGVFVGILPLDAPRFVIAVGVDVDGDGYSGGTIAAPAFARVGAALP